MPPVRSVRAVHASSPITPVDSAGRGCGPESKVSKPSARLSLGKDGAVLVDRDVNPFPPETDVSAPSPDNPPVCISKLDAHSPSSEMLHNRSRGWPIRSDALGWSGPCPAITHFVVFGRGWTLWSG